MKELEISFEDCFRRLGDGSLSGDEAADGGALCGEGKGFEGVGLSGLYRLF